MSVHFERDQIMMNREFITQISAEIRNNRKDLHELRECLVKFRNIGMEKEYMYASLEEMRRQSESDETKDIIMDLMDFVVGFCSSDSAIYSE